MSNDEDSRYEGQFGAERGATARRHLKLQKLIVSITVPFTVLFLSWWLYTETCWQSWVVLVGFLLTSASWIYAIKLTAAENLQASATVFVGSMIAQQALTMSLYEGLSTVSLLADIVVIIYASQFRTRLLHVGAAGVIVSVALSEYLKYAALYGVKGFSRGLEAVFITVFTLLILPIIAFLLRRVFQIQRDLFRDSEKMNREQKEIIEAAVHTGQVLENVVENLKDASETFVSRASEQAVAIKEVHQGMEEIAIIAGETATSAKNTNLFSSRVQDKVHSGSEQLREMAQGFEEIVETSEVFSVEFADLARQAESIEDVLSANQEIAGQIKILAVNASIQAAKAGRYGPGFRVVASELKSMILRTEESLVQSTRLLEQIRNRARRSSDTIQKSTELQRDQLEKINSTRWLINEISGALSNTAEKFETITEGSVKQQDRLQRVGGGLSEIDLSAGELSASTEILAEAVNRIMEANRNLRQVLAAYQG